MPRYPAIVSIENRLSALESKQLDNDALIALQESVRDIHKAIADMTQYISAIQAWISIASDMIQGGTNE